MIGARGDDTVAFEVDHIDEPLGEGWSAGLLLPPPGPWLKS